MKLIKADLHIHSVLSPCGSLEMSPRAIVGRAQELGLDLIAVADHNSMANSLTTGRLAQKNGLGFLYAIEAQSQEEVHLLGYFAQAKQAEQFYLQLESFLPNLPNDAEFFGDQLIVDGDDEIVASEERQLISALNLDIDQLTELIRAHGGVAVPAHVSAEQFGIYRHLGFLPPCLAQASLEIDYRTPMAMVMDLDPSLTPERFICNSDAHYLNDIGRGQTFFDFAGGPILEIFNAAHRLYQPRLGNKNDYEF